MASPWDRLGQAASVMQLIGVDALGLVNMIVQAAHTARRNRDLCLQLAEQVEIVGGLLGELQIPELRRRQVTRRTLDQLNDVLLRAYKLVRFCSHQQQTRSQLYQMFNGDNVAAMLRQAQEEIDRYINLVPVIATVAVFGGQGTQEETEDEPTNDPTPAERPSLSLQEFNELLALEEPLSTGTVAVRIQELRIPPRIVRNDIAENVPSKPGRRNNWLPDYLAEDLMTAMLDGFKLKLDGVPPAFRRLRKATGGFSPETKIGRGRFGDVHWGKLSDGREVAIKRSEFGPRAPRFKEEYQSELAFLSGLQHQHLVRLLEHRVSHVERLLVYEYMTNRSLHDHLHTNAPDAPPSPVASSWKLRIKILLGASRGIAYLHSCAVIHGAIKSSNILLDGAWIARVSDFLGSLMEAEGLWSPGYVDPEHDVLQRLTVKSDVYSFGVVMLEALTGKRPIFEGAGGGKPMSVVACNVRRAAYFEELEHEVLDQRAPKLTAHEAKAVELVASTAECCVQPEGKDRPTMANVVARLETAVALCEGR